MIESLKKNEAIKELVDKMLIVRVGETRTVHKVLEVMLVKLSKATKDNEKDLQFLDRGEEFCPNR